MHAMRMGPGKHLQGRGLMNGLVKPEEFDYFHEVCTPFLLRYYTNSCTHRFFIVDHYPRICSLKSSRLRRWQVIPKPGRRRLLTHKIGLLGGKVIGLPPVLNFGSDEVKAKVIPEVLEGRKFICLAISEAHAGSDVMGLQTTAVKSEDGTEWIINGMHICRMLVFFHQALLTPH